MSLQTIDQPTTIDLRRLWGCDAEVRAHFRALYRQLRMPTDSQKAVRVVGVTSCFRGEGVSTIASRLAVVAARQCEQKVLLVDANPAAPSVHQTFSVDPNPGLLNVVHGSSSLAAAVHASGLENLWVVPAGGAVDKELIDGGPPVGPPTTLHEILNDLSREFSFIVVDMAPVDQFGGVFGTGSGVDGVILVVEADCTRQSHARVAMHALSQTRVLGAILNKR